MTAPLADGHPQERVHFLPGVVMVDHQVRQTLPQDQPRVVVSGEVIELLVGDRRIALQFGGKLRRKSHIFLPLQAAVHFPNAIRKTASLGRMSMAESIRLTRSMISATNSLKGRVT